MLIKKVFLYGHFRVIIQLLSSYEGNKIYPSNPSPLQSGHTMKRIFYGTGNCSYSSGTPTRIAKAILGVQYVNTAILI